MGDVQLTISKDIVQPIVDAKVKEAVLAAMGGSEKIVEVVIDRILQQKVDKDGKVSSYSSDNKFTWMDIVITNTIQEEVRKHIKEMIIEASDGIKEALQSKLKTKAGTNQFAQALLDGFTNTFESNWRSTLQIQFNKETN